MAPKKAAQLPPPPNDLNSRGLPLRQIRADLWRIHCSSHSSLHFNKDGMGRFNDPLKKFGVFYAAFTPEGAFAEVFLRPLSKMIISEAELHERSISCVACNSVTCVDLTGDGLRQLSCDNRVSTEVPYRMPQLWSRAVFEHPDKPDGIIYLSRHNPEFECVALFDRSKPRLRAQRTEPLMGAARRAWTAAQIDRYSLAIRPVP